MNIDSLYTRKDELETIVDGIDSIVDNISDKYYIDVLNEAKYEAENELDEIDDKIVEYEDEAEKEESIEFERSRI